MNVVNNCAERGVKLTSDFAAVARKEQHLQNVLQAVEHERSQQPNLRRCKRKVIASSSQANRKLAIGGLLLGGGWGDISGGRHTG
ncbi:hypothetical protein CgunFtcFv8_026305 [Champsocephalus gunnari]|uniref:Uncharacterized protein n=1 Tax=Champsocephalus gunnari TaxID=52237 RepID=A0AAN8H3V0_CHAGU|nr:hypothetical protein CgunFtcFv8_026305 [Champsocephalus gunnari]